MFLWHSLWFCQCMLISKLMKLLMVNIYDLFVCQSYLNKMVLKKKLPFGVRAVSQWVKIGIAVA